MVNIINGINGINIFKIIVCGLILIILLKKIYEVAINIRESYKNIFTFNSILVNNNKSRKKGLMNRKNPLKENEGMLFDFIEPQVISLWMKNTYIPLDAIYFNKEGKILDLKENLIPHSVESVISKQLCRYVLEVNGGTIKNKNIKLGDYIKINKISKFSK